MNSTFELIQKVDIQEIDIQSINEIDEMAEEDVWVVQTTINKLIKAVRQLDKKIKENKK